MNGEAINFHRQQNLYWNQLIELKVAAGYIRRRRDDLGKKVTALATLKAVASSGGIAAWAIWKEYAFLWARSLPPRNLLTP
jgi:hypothetical protein